MRADEVNVAALELIAESGEVGLGFVQTLFTPLPDQSEIERVFRTEAWPSLEGQPLCRRRARARLLVEGPPFHRLEFGTPG